MDHISFMKVAPNHGPGPLGKVLLESVDKFKTAQDNGGGQEREMRPERALPERREEDRDAG